ncbi:MAG: hypothetical protein IJP14_00770 [Clostridia bacterium]|nr:hypothetical protein [Clostridia bacterium]
MNETKLTKRSAALVLAAVLLLGLLSGCGGGTAVPPSQAVCDFVTVGTDITEQVKNLTEDAILLENGGSVLTMSADGILRVVRGERTVWSTGLSLDDKNALGEVDAASSAAVFRYHVSGESEKTMNSYTDAYAKGQYRLYQDGNSIVYEQIAGEFTADVLLPEALSEERYAEIVGKLNETDATFISRQYTLYTPDTATAEILKTVPNLKKKAFYVVMDAESFVKRKRLQETFSKAGYTTADLDADRKEAGIDTVNQGEVFKLVMRFTLEDGELIVDIPCDQIYYPSDKPLVSVDLMKYGAFALNGSNGSYVVPSGSGALFSFADDKTADYTLQYGGKDYTTESATDATDYSGHPFFGTLGDANACVGIIEEGAEHVRLRIESTQNGYIQYPELRLMSYEISGLGQSRKFYQYGKEAFSGNVRIRYTFLEGTEATYSGVATRYGKYLRDSAALGSQTVSESLPLQLEVINNLHMIKTTAGITYTTEQLVTTFEETQNMLAFFKEQGVANLSLKLNGANARGLFAQAPGSFRFSGAAGGKKGYAALQNFCREQNIPLFLNVNLPFYYADSTWDGYSATGDTARLLNKKQAQLSYKEKSTNANRQDLPLIEVVSPRLYTALAKQYVALSDLLGSGLSVGEFARVLNSDYNDEDTVIRCETKAQVQESLQLLSETYDLLAEDPSAETLSNFERVEKLSLTDNGDSLWTRSVPLIPLALHGYIDYTSTYWNDVTDSTETMLKAIEYGSGMAYRLAQNVTKDVTATHNNFLFNVDFNLWKDTITEQYRYVSKALEGLNQVPMVSHEMLTDDVVKVTYQNGTVLYVNYGDASAVVDENTVEAHSYLRIN